MGMYHSITEQRLREILRRQDPPRFGPGYEPAIKAVREEAPPLSRPADVWSEQLQRNICTLSGPERAVLPFVLKHPKLLDLQEERMLPYNPAPHPLHGHPLAIGMVLPSFRGTLEIAAELNALHLHPVLKIASNGGGYRYVEVPTPWLGDFLVFLLDPENGTPYCVNLSVKSTRDEFRRPQVGVTAKTDMKKAEEREAARHLVEEILCRDVGIPTHFIASDELDPIVVANLQDILLWQKRRAPFQQPQQEDIVGSFNDGLRAGKSALEVIHAYSASNGCRSYDLKIILYQAIWHDQLKIDLFQYFFVDHPLVPEQQSVFDLCGHWFTRP